MDQIRVPNIAAEFQQGYGFGAQVKQQREAEKNRNMLRELAPRVLDGDLDAMSQATAIDPTTANKYNDVGVDIAKRAAGAASFILDAVKRQNPREIEGRYQAVLPFLTKVGAPQGKVPPPNFDQAMIPLMEQLVARAQGLGVTDPSAKMFSQKVGANGNILNTMADGTLVDTGVQADRQMWFRDQAGVEPGLVDKTGATIPLRNTGQLAAAPQPPAFALSRLGEVSDSDPVAARLQAFSDQLRQMNLPAEQQQVLMTAFEQQQNVVPMPIPESTAPQPPTQAPSVGGSTGPAAMRPAPGQTVPSGYRQREDGMGLEAIPGGPAQVAMDARADAAAARQAAEAAKDDLKRQASDARQMEATNAADQLITAIDSLTKHEGFNDLGTAWGDAKIATPLIRNAAKDANAQLKNVAGQVALSTMARLKALSSSGATGFGSLTKPELTLLENSIATLQSENISNAQLRSSLKIIRDTLDKTKQWKPQASPATPDDGVDDLLLKYGAQ